MINIFSVACGLGFAPYLLDSLDAYFDHAEQVSSVIRQGGSGLIIRSDDALMLRFRNRECAINAPERDHFRATVAARVAFYDIQRLEDEIVISSFGDHLLISHPQSELWLNAEMVAALLRSVDSGPGAELPESDGYAVPDWLIHSAENGGMLISDRRNGRWVLLGSEHLDQFRSRLSRIEAARMALKPGRPPVLNVKGVTVHLHSAFAFCDALESFTNGALVQPLDERAPAYSLSVSQSGEGLEISDGDQRAPLNTREARKWLALVRDQLDKMNASQANRGRIRTVFADDEAGRWALQWGDEVLVPTGSSSDSSPETQKISQGPGLAISKTGELTTFLDPSTANCVALDRNEIAVL
jgi:hypothetical protein